MLQDLVDEGVFPIRMDAFDCLYFDHKDERFLSSERMQFDITGHDEDFVTGVIDYVVREVSEWYKADPDGKEQNDCLNNLFEREWNTNFEIHRLLV